MKRDYLVFFLFLSLAGNQSCADDENNVPSEQPIFAKVEHNEEFSGGINGTVFTTSTDAFGLPLGALNGEQGGRFAIGDSFFTNNWVSAPSSTTARDGLGPFFNAKGCADCHSKDGRGRPPRNQNDVGEGLLLRLSVAGGKPDPVYGDQFQDQAVFGQIAEGLFEIDYQQIPGKYPDGKTYTLRKPTYRFTKLNYGPLAQGIMISPRIAQQIVGLGLLESIDESTIASIAWEQDKNNDGISGRVNYVVDRASGQRVLGRFGWKANESSITNQTAGAFHGDIGITSPVMSKENCPNGVDCDKIPNGGNPEITEDNFEDVVFYVKTLAVPGRRNWKNKTVLRGKALMKELNCITCHKPAIKTGVSQIKLLSNQLIRPYTDMLLHDMGEGLADNRPDGEANGKEWRTAPLWGIGLTERVNKNKFFLHDGRARSLEEAILWHGGEAEKSKEGFVNLSEEDRKSIITFLNSL